MSRRYLIAVLFILFGIKIAISFDYTKYLFCQFHEISAGRLTAFTGDAFSYVPAMENYIDSGEYYFEFQGRKVYGGRVPHYSIPYYFLRFFFNRRLSLDLFIVFQILLESVAFLLVSLLVFELTKRRLLFYLSLVFSAGSSFYLHYSLIPIADSPASSLLLISFWFLYRYLGAAMPSFRNWIFFSILAAISTILRPYFILIFIFVGVYMLLRSGRTFKDLAWHAVVYPIALLILLSPWIIRNYARSKKFFLFQEDKYAGYGVGKESELTQKLLAAIGEDATTMWDKTTAAGFFSPSMYKVSEWKVPQEIAKDSILNSNFFAIRSLCTDSVNDNLQSAEFNLHYNTFMDRYKSENSARYYFLNYISRIGNFLFHSGSYYYAVDPKCGDGKNYIFKVMQSMLYYLCLVPGFLGLLLLAGLKKYGVIFLIPMISLIIIFPIILGATEWRYFLPFYFFSQIGLFYLFDRTLFFLNIKN